MRIKPYKHFDSPTKPFAGTSPYIPRRARHPEVIAERRTLPPGGVLTEQQRRGACIAASVIENMGRGSESFVIKTVGATAIGTGAHSIEQARSQPLEVMRSRLHMPWLIRDRDARGPNHEELVQYAQNAWDGIAGFAGNVALAVAEQRRDVNTRRMAFGKVVGRASLVLANIHLGDTIQDASPAQAQTWSREQGLMLWTEARDLANELGSIPSLAQLADPDSDLSVYFRRNAPNDAYDAFSEAQAQYAMPR